MAINPKDQSIKSLELNSNLRLFQIYKNLKSVSLKVDTYFQAYEEMFSKYVGHGSHFKTMLKMNTVLNLC